jgi:hypothetical protein
MTIAINEQVLVKHTVAYDKNRMPFITGSKRHVIQRVNAVYIDGRIRTSSGDVWEVRRNDAGRLETKLTPFA